VTQIKDRLATVQLELQAGCGACGNEGCKTSRHALQAYNRDDVAIGEGDEVEILVEGKAQLEGAFWVLAFPLALFIGGYFAARALIPTASGEGPAALGGLAGLAVGALIGVLVQKRKRLDSLPRIVRKVEAREPDEDEIAAADAAAEESMTRGLV